MMVTQFNMGSYGTLEDYPIKYIYGLRFTNKGVKKDQVVYFVLKWKSTFNLGLHAAKNTHQIKISFK